MSEQPTAADCPDTTLHQTRRAANERDGLVVQRDSSSDLSQNSLVHRVYHGNLVHLRVSDQIPRSAAEAAKEETVWENEVGGMWNIREDGRWHLTLAKRWLRCLHIGNAQNHVLAVSEDESNVSGLGWTNGKHTTVLDLLDDGTEYRYSTKTKSKKPELDEVNPVSTQVFMRKPLIHRKFQYQGSSRHQRTMHK